MARAFRLCVLVLLLKFTNATNDNEDASRFHYRTRRTSLSSEDIDVEAAVQAELNTHVRNIIAHFKQDDPRGVPAGMKSHIPDPMPVPNLEKEFSGTKMTFDNMTVHGLNRFRLEHVRTDASALKISVGVSIDQLQILGLYSMQSWWTRARGNFNVTILNVSAEAEGSFSVSPEGFLIVEHIDMDLNFEDIKMNFENLGFLGKIFQGMVNSVGSFLFDSIKPMILQEVQQNIRGALSRELRSVPQQFPNSINPLDMAIASARNLMKERGLDPLPLPDYKADSWSSSFHLSKGELQGLSTLHRTGSILIGFEKNTIHVTLHLGAENLKGSYKWSWGIMRNMMKRTGAMEFNLEYLKVSVKVQQPANLDLLPSIDKIDLDVGNIAVLSDGAGTLDYVVEAVFNIVPNIFRKQIIDSLEYPVCKAIEEEMRKLKLEEMIEENL